MNRINLDAAALEPKAGRTSKGDQPKWQMRGNWYKADHMGYEALAEVLVSGLLKKSNVSDFVDYQLVQIHDHGKERIGCASKNFRGKDEMLIPFQRLHRAYQGAAAFRRRLHPCRMRLPGSGTRSILSSRQPA